jgi:hypothetical protein
MVDAKRERPDPEVPERARRRTFTAKYKLEVLAAYEAAPAGAKGCSLRGDARVSQPGCSSPLATDPGGCQTHLARTVEDETTGRLGHQFATALRTPWLRSADAHGRLCGLRVGVILALFAVGHVSDWNRWWRVMILVAAFSAVLFLPGHQIQIDIKFVGPLKTGAKSLSDDASSATSSPRLGGRRAVGRLVAAGLAKVVLSLGPHVAQVVQRPRVGVDQCRFAVGDGPSSAKFLDDRLATTKVTAWHTGKQVVLDLIVEATEDRRDQAATRHVARRQHLTP